MSLVFPHKRFASIQSSWLEPRKVREMTIVGTRRMIVYDDLEPQEKTFSDYPERGYVLDGRKTTEQQRTYWCGPATMQMIGWGWRNKRSQDTWASRLGTTRNGSAVTDMVRVTNRYTGWDQEQYAGRYIVLDIKDWSYGKWWLLQMRPSPCWHEPSRWPAHGRSRKLVSACAGVSCWPRPVTWPWESATSRRPSRLRARRSWMIETTRRGRSMPRRWRSWPTP